MSQFFTIHPDNPQARLIRQAVDTIQRGGVVVYPTDSAYALGCQMGTKTALETIRRIRKLDDDHNFTLICRDLSDLGTYARVDNTAYRAIRHATPGPYTFILEATSEVPKRLAHPKRKTIGVRVPQNNIAQALLAELGEAMMSVTLILPGDEYPLSDPYDIRALLEHEVDLVIDGGYCGLEPTSVIDMHQIPWQILRVGLGDVADFDLS